MMHVVPHELSNVVDKVFDGTVPSTQYSSSRRRPLYRQPDAEIIRSLEERARENFQQYRDDHPKDTRAREVEEEAMRQIQNYVDLLRKGTKIKSWKGKIALKLTGGITVGLLFFTYAASEITQYMETGTSLTKVFFTTHDTSQLGAYMTWLKEALLIIPGAGFVFSGAVGINSLAETDRKIRGVRNNLKNTVLEAYNR